jgi:hypothetical protein
MLLLVVLFALSLVFLFIVHFGSCPIDVPTPSNLMQKTAAYFFSFEEERSCWKLQFVLYLRCWAMGTSQGCFAQAQLQQS